MENAYPGSNMLVVTLTNGESKRVEAQSDQDTLREAMEVLRNMFGPDIPDATDILVPRWWNNRFQRGSYSNYPIYANHQLVHAIKVSNLTLFSLGNSNFTPSNLNKFTSFGIIDARLYWQSCHGGIVSLVSLLCQDT